MLSVASALLSQNLATVYFEDGFDGDWESRWVSGAPAGKNRSKGMGSNVGGSLRIVYVCGLPRSTFVRLRRAAFGHDRSDDDGARRVRRLEQGNVMYLAKC